MSEILSMKLDLLLPKKMKILTTRFTPTVTVRQNSCLFNTKETHEREKTCFKIVPIRVKDPFKEVQTYAFNDSGSDATM